MLTPTRSAGSRSGVNCTRFHVQSIDAASALARLVLPTPGTSSMSRWPSASRHDTASSIASFLPWTTRAMLLVMASKSDAKVRVGAVWVAVTDGRVDGARRDCNGGRLRSGRVTRCYLAVDVGGTKLAAGVVDDRADPGARSAADTASRRVADAVPVDPASRGRGARRPRSAAGSAAAVRSTRRHGPVSPLYIPTLARLPAGCRAGGAAAAAGCGRHRRQGAGARPRRGAAAPSASVTSSAS